MLCPRISLTTLSAIFTSACLAFAFAPTSARAQAEAGEESVAELVRDAIERMSGAPLSEVYVAADDIADRGEEAVPFLRRALETEKDPLVQLGMLRALADLDHADQAEERLLELAGVDQEPAVRVAALDLIESLPGTETLAKRLSDQLDRTFEPAVKVALAKALYNLASGLPEGPDFMTRARDELRTLLKSENLDYRVAGALALAELKDFESARPVLREIENDPGLEGRLARAYIRTDSLHRFYARQEERLLKQGGGQSDMGNLDVLREIIDHVQAEHLLGEHFQGAEGEERLITAAAKGLLSYLDPHSTYFSPDEYRNWLLDLQRDYAGIGAYVDTIDGVFTITRPIYDGPAYKAGLRSDDKILAVDGWETYDRPQQEVIDKLKGKPGTSVTVKVARLGWTEAREFTIPRAVVTLKSVNAELFPGGVGYVEVETFASETHNELVKCLNELERRGAKGLILDLRFNSGGYMQQAINMVGEFVGPGKLVVYTEGRQGEADANRQEYRTDFRARGREQPLIVLVNRRSASASEIVAGALRKYERAVLVGEHTFGKGSVQNPFQLKTRGGEPFADRNTNEIHDANEDWTDLNKNEKYDYPSMFKLTTQRYFLPDGNSIHTEVDPDGRVISKGGIEPDHPIKFADVAPWKAEELADLFKDEAFTKYVDQHFAAYRDDPAQQELLVALAEGDERDTTRYPGFDEFYQSLNTHIDRDEVRRWLRVTIRNKVSDLREKVFPGNQLMGDYQEDNQLQYAIVVLLEKLGVDPGSIPDYAGFADIRRREAAKQAKADADEDDQG